MLFLASPDFWANAANLNRYPAAELTLRHSGQLTGRKVAAVDVGGTLTKVVYASADDLQNICFAVFESRDVSQWSAFLDKLEPKILIATGGGAHKQKSLMTDIATKHGGEYRTADEMAGLAKGLSLLSAIPGEPFSWKDGQRLPLPAAPVSLPCLLVNMGSGISIVKLAADGSHARVGGTQVGGGTFAGLGYLLAGGVSDFEEMLALARRGESAGVDLTVGDIFGSDYSAVGLSAATVASSFAKAWIDRANPPADRRQQSADALRSLQALLCYNVGNIAGLLAKREGCDRIYFGGYFVRNEAFLIDTLATAVQRYSGGSIQPVFLVHSGYIGALASYIGAF